MVDVIVVGGGTSGFIAAIAAARAGAKVIILEQSSYLGGTMTGGLVPGLVSMRHQPWKDQETLVQMESLYTGNQVVRGIAQEYVDRLIAANGAFGHAGEAPVRVLFDPEVAKWVIEQMVHEAGVNVRYYSKVVAVLKDAAQVCGVRVDYGEEIRGKVVIDATGDGHVAHLAGVRHEQGEGGVATMVQPISLYFVMEGMELDRTIAYVKSAPQDYSAEYIAKLAQLRSENKPLTLIGFPSLRDQAMRNGDYPIPYGTTAGDMRKHNCLARSGFRDGKVRYNLTMHNVDMAYRVDATDTAQLSEAIIAMRDFTFRMGRFFKKYVPGFENAYVLQVADLVGVRESRRMVGDYVLTGDDVLEGRRFDDSVGYCGATVDIHNVEGGRQATHMQAIHNGGAYQVPYRMLLPEGVDGLLLTGRCVSADRIAFGSIRQQAGCLVTGQAAGVAAALAARENTSPRKIKTETLQNALREQGALV